MIKQFMKSEFSSFYYIRAIFRGKQPLPNSPSEEYKSFVNQYTWWARNPLASRFDERPISWWRVIRVFFPGYPWNIPARTLYPNLFPSSPYTDPNIRYIPNSVWFSAAIGTLTRNFVSQFPCRIAYVYELTGPCMKFCETVPGKRGFPRTKEEACTDTTDATVRQRDRRFSPAAIWFIQKVGETYTWSVTLKAEPATSTRSRIAGLSLPPYSNQRRILVCFNLI